MFYLAFIVSIFLSCQTPLGMRASTHAGEDALKHPKRFLKSLGLGLFGFVVLMMLMSSKAIKYYSKAIKIDPENATYHLPLGFGGHARGSKKKSSSAGLSCGEEIIAWPGQGG